MNALMGAPMIHLRAAEVADAPFLVRLLDQLGYPGTAGFIEDRIRQLASHPDEVLLIGEADSRPVAFISIHFIPQIARPGDFARISYFCVDESARNAGIGAAMEAHCEALARARGCDRIELHSHSRRVAAHRFYERRGYVDSPKYLMKSLSELAPNAPPPST